MPSQTFREKTTVKLKITAHLHALNIRDGDENRIIRSLLRVLLVFPIVCTACVNTSKHLSTIMYNDITLVLLFCFLNLMARKEEGQL